jgi:hypothetical protein
MSACKSCSVSPRFRLRRSVTASVHDDDDDLNANGERDERAKVQHHVIVQRVIILSLSYQNPACAASRSARLPRAAHLLTCSNPSSWTPSCSVGRPQPPPPGVSIRRRSPLPMRIVAFPPMFISRAPGKSLTRVSPSSSRPCLTQVLRPVPAGAPPSRPYGARVRRYKDGLHLPM